MHLTHLTGAFALLAFTSTTVLAGCGSESKADIEKEERADDDDGDEKKRRSKDDDDDEPRGGRRQRVAPPRPVLVPVKAASGRAQR